MELYCLASSSAGNSYILKLDRGEGLEPFSLMVECGLNYQTLVRRLTQNNVSIGDIGACLITHSHNDHSACAKDLDKRGIGIYATKDTLKAIGVGGNPMQYSKPSQIGDKVYAMPFKVRHDAIGSAGFIIKTPVETIVFAIDSAYWEQDISAIKPDYLFIEANYDKMIMDIEQMSLRKNASVEDMQKYRRNQRVLNYHSSFQETLIQIGKVNKSRLKTIFLTHLSDRMSNAPLWKKVVESKYAIPCHVCRKNGGID